MKAMPTSLRALACMGAGLLAAFVGAPGAPAVAEEGGLPATTRFFEAFDRNHDGVVTAEEFGRSPDVFRLLDKDRNGSIEATDLGLPATWRPVPQSSERVRGREGAGENPARGGFFARIREMDANGDGRIARDEWRGRVEMFDRLDRNADGALDAADMPGRGAGRGGLDAPRPGATPPEPMPREARVLFDEADLDDDGELDADELAGRPDLRAWDADRDGRVSTAECEAQRSPPSNEGDGDPPGRPRGRAFDAAQLRRFDRDGDGRVDRTEFPGPERAFDRIDTNQDGYLDAADLPAKPKPPAGAGG